MRKAALILACLTVALLFAGCAGKDETLLAETQEGNVLKATGTYMGLADNNFFELQIEENTYKVFMITAKTRTDFDKLKLQTGDKIAIDYVRNKTGQLETQKIERIKDSVDVSGKYLGLADNNFFEVTVKADGKDKPMVFMLTDKVRDTFDKLKLKKNDAVKINYTENSDGQLIVNSIKKGK